MRTSFELWNEEYGNGIKTRGDKIGMAFCIINDVRQQTTMPTDNTSPILLPSAVWKDQATSIDMYILFTCRMCM